MEGPFVPMPPRILGGDERTAAGQAQIIDFWRWAFSDVRDNTTRDVFAEWLVGVALGCAHGVRIGWASHDLTTSDGVRVEVKSTGYLQAWETPRLSELRFSGMAGRSRDPIAGYSTTVDYRADMYVFCVLTCTDHNILNPLDVTQWDFWVAPRAAVASAALRSIGLSRVRTLAKGPLTYETLPAAVADAHDASGTAVSPSA